MEFEVVKENSKVVGFDMSACGVTEEEVFCSQLPMSLVRGVAEISIISNEIVIENRECDMWPKEYSFKIGKEERDALRKFLESDDTQPKASLRQAFGPIFQVRFQNKRLEHIEKTRYPGDKHRKRKQKRKKRSKKG